MKTEVSTPEFTDGIFVTPDGREALKAFQSRRSVIARRVDGWFYIFSPASAAIGHHTAEYRKQ